MWPKDVELLGATIAIPTLPATQYSNDVRRDKRYYGNIIELFGESIHQMDTEFQTGTLVQAADRIHKDQTRIWPFKFWNLDLETQIPGILSVPL